MPRAFLAAAIVLGGLAEIGHTQALVPLSPGMVIDRSVTVRPGVYALTASADLKKPALTIRGGNITVDFNGARLSPYTEPSGLSALQCHSIFRPRIE